MPVASKPNILVDIRKLAFAYRDQRVLEGITLTIRSGEYVGIIGPNGGGKTTLLKLILGMLAPTDGSVHVRIPRHEIGYVPQRAGSIELSFPATVREVVESGRVRPRGWFLRRDDRTAVDEALATTGVAHLAARRIVTLSGGERQRVLIARALAARPKMLVLDEPTTAVDIMRQEELYAFLRDLHTKAGMTIVVVSHDIDALSHEVSRVICLNRHLVCHGAPSEVMKHAHIEHYGH